MKIVLNIEDDNDIKFRKAFLRVHPIPNNPETGLEEMTTNEWIRKWTVNKLQEVYNEGVRKLEVDKIYIIRENIIS
jgi:hypothetical protein